MEKRFVIIGSGLFCLAILFGAFGAHALKNILIEEKLDSFEVGVRYQMFQALSIMLIGLNKKLFGFSLKTVLFLMTLGTILFSFSIYILAISSLFHVSLKFIGPITPIGGIILLISWSIFILKTIKKT